MGRVAFIPEITDDEVFTWEWTQDKTKLAKQFSRHETVDYIQLQWNRKFRETGDFALYMRAKDYDPSARFVVAEQRPEVGIIQKIEYNSDITGDFVTLSGFFADKIMDFTVLSNDLNLDWPCGENWKIAGNDPSAPYPRDTVDNEYSPAIEKIEKLIIKCSWALPGWLKKWSYFDKSGYVSGRPYNRYASVVVDSNPYYDTGARSVLGAGHAIVNESIEAGAKMGEALYKILQNTKCGLSPVLIYDGRSLQLKLRFFSGYNHENTVIFSRENGNTDFIKYRYDWSNAARRAVIQADIMSLERTQNWQNPVDPGEKIAPKHLYEWDYFYPTDQPGEHGPKMQVSLFSSKVFAAPTIRGWPNLHPEIYVNPQLENPDKTKALALCKDCDSAARLELLNHLPETDVEVGAPQVTGCEYLEHYDLGDTVTVRIDAIKEQFTQRIIEVNEVWENNQETPSLVFGNKRRVKYRSPQDTKYAKNRTR